jgi:hypothetical protein
VGHLGRANSRAHANTTRLTRRALCTVRSPNSLLQQSLHFSCGIRGKVGIQITARDDVLTAPYLGGIEMSGFRRCLQNHVRPVRLGLELPVPCNENMSPPANAWCPKRFEYDVDTGRQPSPRRTPFRRPPHRRPVRTGASGRLHDRLEVISGHDWGSPEVTMEQHVVRYSITGRCDDGRNRHPDTPSRGVPASSSARPGAVAVADLTDEMCA